jgi:hypothetical protein
LGAKKINNNKQYQKSTKPFQKAHIQILVKAKKNKATDARKQGINCQVIELVNFVLKD